MSANKKEKTRIHASSVQEQQELMYQSWLNRTPEERIAVLIELIKATYPMPQKLSNRIYWKK